jgi:hypothetical protein
MKDIDSLEQLYLAVRSLRKAERYSQRLCDVSGRSGSSKRAKNEWTRAAVERDRCYEYARKVAAEYFNINEERA